MKGYTEGWGWIRIWVVPQADGYVSHIIASASDEEYFNCVIFQLKNKYKLVHTM